WQSFERAIGETPVELFVKRRARDGEVAELKQAVASVPREQRVAEVLVRAAPPAPPQRSSCDVEVHLGGRVASDVPRGGGNPRWCAREGFTRRNALPVNPSS